jgi:hypothetical protein
MPCPDKYKDRKIIQEIERRKELRPSLPETYQEIFEEIDLLSLVQFLATDDIVSIHKTAQGWTVTKYVQL